MPVQPQLFPDPPPSAFTPGSSTENIAQNTAQIMAQTGPPPLDPGAKPAPLWLQRMSLFVLVLFCVYLGVILIVLPWWPTLWDRNLFLQAHPSIWAILKLGAVRGIISGLGVLDIWIGISEAVHYRDHRD